jgi:hypothetical protein
MEADVGETLQSSDQGPSDQQPQLQANRTCTTTNPSQHRVQLKGSGSFCWTRVAATAEPPQPSPRHGLLLPTESDRWLNLARARDGALQHQEPPPPNLRPQAREGHSGNRLGPKPPHQVGSSAASTRARRFPLLIPGPNKCPRRLPCTTVRPRCSTNASSRRRTSAEGGTKGTLQHRRCA